MASYLNQPAFRRRVTGLLRGQAARRARTRFDWSRTALLVIDMQRYFLESRSHACIPGAREVIAKTAALLAVARERKAVILFTRHVNTRADAGALARWWADTIRRRDPLSQITSELDTGGNPVIEKTQYDAFFHTLLETKLRRRRIQRLIVCGVVTNLCCETTIRSAFVRGFDVWLPVDATGAYAADTHLASLRNLAHGFAILTTVAELTAPANGESSR